MDKIGLDGIIEELLEKGCPDKAVQELTKLLYQGPLTLDTVSTLLGKTEPVENLTLIIEQIEQLSDNRFRIQFDLTLVRGQGYYTGTIFKIKSNDFYGSIGGGGRYDNLIGKFAGEPVPAVGFSIGFERLYSILADNNFNIPDVRKKIAVLYSEANYVTVTKIAEAYRQEYIVTIIDKPKKLGKFLRKLEENNYFGYIDSEASNQLHLLNS